jgi:peptidyl-tRNA hydrolase
MTAVLYIIMRNDLSSMNSGKAMAQASHASNAFVHHFNRYAQNYNAKPTHDGIEASTMKGFNEWENSTRQGFGTVLVLSAKMPEISSVIEIFSHLGYLANTIHDPTYPIVDGEIVHHIPLDTCGYVFVPNKEEDIIANTILKKFPLHP